MIDNTAPIIDPITNIVLTAGLDCTAALPNLTNEVTATDCSPFAQSPNPHWKASSCLSELMKSCSPLPTPTG